MSKKKVYVRQYQQFLKVKMFQEKKEKCLLLQMSPIFIQRAKIFHSHYTVKEGWRWMPLCKAFKSQWTL